MFALLSKREKRKGSCPQENLGWLRLLEKKNSWDQNQNLTGEISLCHENRSSSPDGFLYWRLRDSFRSRCPYFTWHFQCRMVLHCTALHHFGSLWALHTAFALRLWIWSHSITTARGATGTPCPIALLWGDSMGRRDILNVRGDVSSLELCRGGTTGHLVWARTCWAAVTQARQGERIEKQSPTVLIFGFKMLSLEAQ